MSIHDSSVCFRYIPLTILFPLLKKYFYMHKVHWVSAVERARLITGCTVDAKMRWMHVTFVPTLLVFSVPIETVWTTPVNFWRRNNRHECQQKRKFFPWEGILDTNSFYERHHYIWYQKKYTHTHKFTRPGVITGNVFSAHLFSWPGPLKTSHQN